MKGLCDEGLYNFAYRECPWDSLAYANGFVKELFDENAPSRVQSAFNERALSKRGSEVGITERPPGKRASKAGLSKRVEIYRFVSAIHGIADIGAIRSQFDTNIES